LLTDWDEISNLHRGHSIDASYQVLVPHAILVSDWLISKKSSPLLNFNRGEDFLEINQSE
jgi:hypothetical protein